MNIRTNKALRFEDFNVALNQEEVHHLFQQYEQIGFLYPAKKALLAPHLKEITHNWETLINSKEEFLWVLTHQHNNNYSSVCAWKQSNYCMLAQHLVSTGNPFLSLKVMLASQFRAEYCFSKNEVNASQNWFRPNNRYAYRVFASMYKKLGPKKSNLRAFDYLHLLLTKINTPTKNDFIAEPISGIDLEFIQFVQQQYGEVFVQAEELNQNDLELTSMNQLYQSYGLQRYRRIVNFRCKSNKQIVASAIINRAPLGINFSFLENRTYYIISEDLTSQERLQLIEEMNDAVKAFYQDFALQVIPIVTDGTSSKILQQLSAKFLRVYMQSIWMRSGFALWFDHIYSFLKRIEGRQLIRKAS